MNTYLVLLASGNSVRFGSNKLLYKIDGKEMYKYIVEQLEPLKHRFKKMIVVSQYEEILGALSLKDYVTIYNTNSSFGISSSIHLAIDFVKKYDLENESKHHDGASIMFCVCDQPYLTTSTLQKLLDSYLISCKKIACVGHNGVLGNPAIFCLEYADELSKLSGDHGGKGIINAHKDELFTLNVKDPKELNDIDVK